ncbi:MAG: ribosome biogenesis GTP-binding protein YihA/YsxC [Rariglobus sp.]
MKIKTAEFEKSAPTLATCPRWALPEFAFIGRSNVGKSSLVNLISGRRELAKASVTPGKTKLLNFFRLNGNWSLVDLPGYGYAKVNREERADFNEAVAAFIEKRDNLVRVFVLIDSRLPPQKIDLQFLSWIVTADVPIALVFTKADKQSHSVTQSNITVFKKAIADILPQEPPCFITSSTTKLGATDVLSFIEQELVAVKAANKAKPLPEASS